ncbi:MAG TPA: SGNH/GDSL hydrolase family protein [Actinomycetes bacterium]|nr:SGNH/GDSL hydrolase family protein [Actinomycetes bacterium]
MGIGFRQLDPRWIDVRKLSPRRLAGAALVASGAVVTTLAAEALAARNHRFLPSEPVLEISCVLGPDDAPPLVLAVLGDSSTAGVGAESAEETLTHGVARALAERHRVSLHALGVSGAKLAHVVRDQLPQLAELDPDVVLVCVGTNDITHLTPVHEVRRQLQLLGSGLVTAAPRAVVVVSGLPPAETSLAFGWPLRAVLGAWARAYTRLYQAELTPYGISVVDVAGAARPAFRGRREMFSKDLFHPSGTGYAFLGKFYGNAVSQALDAARAADRRTPPDLAGDLAG